jgi:hypothetical protein
LEGLQQEGRWAKLTENHGASLFKIDLLIDTTFRQIFLAGQSLEVKDRGFMQSTFQDGGSKFQDGGSTVQSVGEVDISMLLQGPVKNSVMYGGCRRTKQQG